jgi:enamine deaminase RidA (YjgF/YER057c/UK114 family)
VAEQTRRTLENVRARTTVFVGLADGMLVEIDALAVVG